MNMAVAWFAKSASTQLCVFLFAPRKRAPTATGSPVSKHVRNCRAVPASRAPAHAIELQHTCHKHRQPDACPFDPPRGLQNAL